MSVKHIFLETMFDDFTPDSVSREELISILLDDLMVVARDNLSIEYLENGGDAEEALKLFSVEMRKNLEDHRVIRRQVSGAKVSGVWRLIVWRKETIWHRRLFSLSRI